jgi:hypothetical protein
LGRSGPTSPCTSIFGGLRAHTATGSGRGPHERETLPPIRFLLSGAKAVKGNGGKLILLSPDEYVYSVLKTAGIDMMMPILFDRSEAIAAVRT